MTSALKRSMIFNLNSLYVNESLRRKREAAIFQLFSDKKKYSELRRRYSVLTTLNMMGIGKEGFFRIMEGIPIELEKDGRLIEVLMKLKSRYKLMVLSNFPRSCVKRTLQGLGVLHLFDDIQSGEKSLKPSKKSFLKVKAKDICIGDDFTQDLDIPKRIGAITIMKGDDFRAHYNIKKIYDIERIIYSPFFS